MVLNFPIDRDRPGAGIPAAALVNQVQKSVAHQQHL
jgi:hypothetical protein